MLKQMSLAALVATFITGSAAVVYAESNISGVDESLTSSAALRDWDARYSDAMSLQSPSASMNAYGYASQRRLDRSHRRDRNNAGMSYNN